MTKRIKAAMIEAAPVTFEIAELPVDVQAILDSLEVETMIATEEAHDAANPIEDAVVSDEDLAAIEAADAIQASYQAQPAPNAVQASAPAVDENRSFQELFDEVDEAAGAKMGAALLAAYAQRAQHERDKSPNNDNIQRTLSNAMKKITPGVSKALVAIGGSESFINADKKRNVYTFPKVRDFLYAAVSGQMENAINKATLKSMVVLMDHKLPFNSQVAKGCASDKFPVEVHYLPHLHRHTVSASTADTQHSSTMSALEILGVVKVVSEGKQKVWEFTETPLAKRLIEVARKMLALVAV